MHRILPDVHSICNHRRKYSQCRIVTTRRKCSHCL